MDYLVDPSFQEVNILFVLIFCFVFPAVEIQDYDVIDGKIFFVQTVKSYLRKYDNIWKLQLVKWIIIEQVINRAILISKNIIR